MIYLVTTKHDFDCYSTLQVISVEESLNMLENVEDIQFDTETSGRNPHLCDILCAQFGYGHGNTQIVVDCSTIDIKLYKDILEKKLIIGHNLKFDLQFLYNYGIIPQNVWDTMVIEQLLHLGFNPKFFRYSLKAVADRYLGIDIDKTIRGEIIWRGLDYDVIKYAAGDVMYLENIRDLQNESCVVNHCTTGAKIENAFVPVIAYLEWCGIRLDVDKWKQRMANNKDKVLAYLNKLNDFIVSRSGIPVFAKYCDNTLFGVYPAINWDSSTQVIPLLIDLGFDTKTEDKKTGESKDSAVAKLLKKQKGINDEFLDIYLKYKEAQKDLSTYGDTYIDAINPITGRIHTTFKQLGADSSRMSCGNSMSNDTDLAKFKHIAESRCKFVQLQNLPHDEFTRASFIPNDGNLMTSCDYAALESRLGADIYNEQSMIDEYLQGSGDR